MKNASLSSAIFSACLLAGSPALAHIEATLESPAEGAVSGPGVVYGWAFTDDVGEDVEVFFRLDGGTLGEIPCCGDRDDVQDAFPDAPEQTSFAFLFNFSLLSPGPHTIGVEIRTEGVPGSEDREIRDRSVFVVRPGNVSLLDSIDLSGATCSISTADDVILLDNVDLMSASGTTETDLDLAFTTSSRSFAVIESADTPPLTSFTANLNGSQEVPPVVSSATGEATLTLNSDNTVDCEVTTIDLDEATVAHIHPGAAGQEGPPLIELTRDGPNAWSCPASAPALTTEQVTALRQALMYFNVHTPANPDGEVRGQIVAPPLS